MNGYFKPLRRKIGVLTLVVACAFAAGWVRSRDRNDFVRIYVGRDQLIDSFNGQIYWGAMNLRTVGPTGRWFEMQLGKQIKDVSETMARIQLSRSFKIRAAKAELHLESFSKHQVVKEGAVDFSEWVIPYWSIVIPLTLFSAWLLLSKPRAAKPKIDSLS